MAAGRRGGGGERRRGRPFRRAASRLRLLLLGALLSAAAPARAEPAGEPGLADSGLAGARSAAAFPLGGPRLPRIRLVPYTRFRPTAPREVRRAPDAPFRAAVTPAAVALRLRAGAYERQAEPAGLVLADEVVGVGAEAALPSLRTTVTLDFVRAIDPDGFSCRGIEFDDEPVCEQNLVLAAARLDLGRLRVGAFALAALDEPLDDEDLGGPRRDLLWSGANARLQVGRLQIAASVVWAWEGAAGDAGAGSRAVAVDQRLEYQLPFGRVRASAGYAGGGGGEAFPVLSARYDGRGIYGGIKGLRGVSRSLTGSAHVSLELEAALPAGVQLQLGAQYAWLTAGDRSGRDVGLALDVEVRAPLRPGARLTLRGAALVSGSGVTVADGQDRWRGVLGQLSVGVAVSF